jgi:hypothetical protein
MNEQEEFEFRLRLEQEAAQPGSVPKPTPTFGEMLKAEALTSLPGGLVRGVKDIIDTGAEYLAAGYDKLTEGDQPTLSSLITGDKPGARARVKKMNAAGKAEFADAQDLVGAGGSNITRVGGNIVATWPVGGVLGTTAKAAGMTRFGNALTSGGFSTGAPVAAGFVPKAVDMGLRMAGGGATGYATAGLVNSDEANTGGVIGAVLPPAAKLAGAAGQRVLQAFRTATTPQEVKIAQQLAAQLGVTADDIKAALTGPQIIPGYQPTVPQIVQNPVASQLQRTLKTAGADALGEADRLQQSQFRDALGRIGPTDVSVQDAANRAGGAIQDFAIPAEKAARARVGGMFDAIPRDQAMIQLPIPQMQAARSKFLGPATFGTGGGAVDQAIDAATAIGTRPAPAMALDYSSSDLARRVAGGHSHTPAGPTVPQAVPFDDIQKLRSSIGEAISQAGKSGNNQAKAALTVMKNAIDDKVAAVAAGEALPGEVFTPQAIDAWGQALQAHGAKKLRFNTGPQVGIFRQGGDGMPQIQGAEIPGKFFNSRRSQVEDVQAFKRLIGDREDLAQEMKRFAIAEGMGTANAAGDLTSKFVAWMKMRSGATGELFTPQEMATLNQVGNAVRRSMKAENLGRVSGSDTAQKLASLQSNGMLDSRLVDVLAHKTPFIGSFTGPVLDSLRKTATQTRQGTMAGLLADPARMESALRQGAGNGLLNFEPETLGLLTRGAYRALPLIPAQ